MKGISFISFLILVGCASEPHHGSNVLHESLRQCYVESDSYTGREGKVQGTMTVGLKLDPKGKVEDCKILKSDFKNDPNLQACVIGIFEKSVITDPALKGKIEVTQLVEFKPVKQ